MGKFLSILLVVFVVCIAALGLSLWKAYLSIRQRMNQFNSRMNGGGFKQHEQQRQTTTDHGDTITDTRSEQQANQKIFDKDEGEYVDFKELN
jgi:cytoskeletal protein RodZ